MQETFICNNYGVEFSLDDIIYVGDDLLCPDCANNLTNSETVELRLFRGTLKLNTLIATLQFVNHLCEVAISLSDQELQDMSWFDFLDMISEPELIQHLKERRLYVNEPVEQ